MTSLKRSMKKPTSRGTPRTLRVKGVKYRRWDPTEGRERVSMYLRTMVHNSLRSESAQRGIPMSQIIEEALEIRVHFSDQVTPSA